jgi:aspartyl-tRNA(Asn)/glutamyl-tRNA(Gln) amidotransferase subunit C
MQHLLGKKGFPTWCRSTAHALGARNMLFSPSGEESVRLLRRSRVVAGARSIFRSRPPLKPASSCCATGAYHLGNASMPLDRTDVEKIAHLARLAISDEEAEGYAVDLSKILDLVEQMNAVSTDRVSPMAHPLNMVQRLREDTPSEPDQRELFQKHAPATEEGLYLVPQVIE